jgi:hypothetical protein
MLHSISIVEFSDPAVDFFKLFSDRFRLRLQHVEFLML